MKDEEIGRMMMAASKKPVVLKGLQIRAHIPTEERLNVQLDGLSVQLFRTLGAEYEDYFAVVDNQYKENRVRGRGWKGRGHKVQIGQPSEEEPATKGRVRSITGSPFPSRFSNILRTLRKRLYELLHKYGFVLEGVQHGGYKQNLYIVPYANMPRFMNAVAEMNKEIDALNVRITEFRTTNYFSQFKTILGKYDLNPELLDRRTFTVEHIDIDSQPLALEPTAVKELVDAEFKQMFERADAKKQQLDTKLQKEYEQGMQFLEAELKRQERERVVKVVENLRSQLEAVAKRIMSIHRKNPTVVKEDLDLIRSKAMSIGLDYLAPTFTEMETAIEHPERVVKMFGTSDLSEGVSARVKSLIDSF